MGRVWQGTGRVYRHALQQQAQPEEPRTGEPRLHPGERPAAGGGGVGGGARERGVRGGAQGSHLARPKLRGEQAALLLAPGRVLPHVRQRQRDHKLQHGLQEPVVGLARRGGLQQVTAVCERAEYMLCCSTEPEMAQELTRNEQQEGYEI